MKQIITISRELGSGGRTIGKLVANKKISHIMTGN
ncbi:MAG: cytidylate kinase-like family protein [Clostridiales bacterium]|nr:cytidylate kinase-like family protein [Clostridiales bacterium]